MMAAPTLADIRRRLQDRDQYQQKGDDEVWYDTYVNRPKPDHLKIRIDTPFQWFNDNPFDDGCNIGAYGAWDWPSGVGRPNYEGVFGWLIGNVEGADFWLHEDPARQYLPDGTRCRGSDNDGFISFWFAEMQQAEKFLARWSGRMVNSRGGRM